MIDSSFKTQIFSAASFAAILPASKCLQTVPNLKDYFFLQHPILKKCVVAILRWFMWAQSNSVLLHEIAFQRFWFDLSVDDVVLQELLFSKKSKNKNSGHELSNTAMKFWLQTFTK